MLLMVLAAVLGTPDLHAQTTPAVLNPRLTVLVGGSFLKGQRLFRLDGNDFQSRFESRLQVGFRGTLDLSDAWGLEGGYAFSPNSLLMTEFGMPTDQRRFDIRVHRIGANALRYFTTDGGLRLSVTAGIGLTHFRPTSEARMLALEENFIDDPTSIHSSTPFNVNFGGGLEARLDSRVGLRVDLRDNISTLPRFGLPDSSSGPGSTFYPVAGSVHDVETTVGLIFYLR